jgi:hypothetical protein
MDEWYRLKDIGQTIKNLFIASCITMAAELMLVVLFPEAPRWAEVMFGMVVMYQEYNHQEVKDLLRTLCKMD